MGAYQTNERGCEGHQPRSCKPDSRPQYARPKHLPLGTIIMSIEIKFVGTGKPDVDAQMQAYLNNVPPPNGGGDGVYTDQDYPLKMPAITDGSPVEIGTGPDAIRISCASNLPDTNVMAIVLDKTAIAGPLTVSGNAWEDQTQIFTLHGKWGAAPHNVQFVPGGAGIELRNLTVKTCTFNFASCGYTGPSLDARGGPDVVGALTVWDNIGAPFIMKVPPDTAPPVPPPSNTTITGATINGTPHAPDTLANLVAATPAGGTLTLPSGTWGGATSMPAPITVTGQGVGVTTIDATSLDLARGKAVFVPLIAGSVFQQMSIKGAAVTDLNGAAIREDAAGIGWRANNLEIANCQDGILSFASNIALTDCSFHDNGAKDAHSHEMYFNGAPNTTVTLTRVTSVAGSGSTHALKSRAGRTVVQGGSYTGNPGANPDDVTGSVLNFPDAGAASIADCTLIIASSGAEPNTVFLTYATESAANLSAGSTVTLTRVRIEDRSGTGGSFDCGGYMTTARLVIGAGCTYVGANAPKFQGWGSVSGSFAKAAA